MILADTFDWDTFPDAIRFIRDHPHLLWDKTLQHLALSGAALGIAIAIALPLGVILGHYHRGSFVAISVVERRPGAAEHRPDRVLPARLQQLLLGQHWRARHPRDPADPDQRLLRGRPGRPERRRFARGMGMTGWQILTTVELPLARR